MGSQQLNKVFPIQFPSNISARLHLPTGSNIYVGAGAFINYNCCILDCGRVDIGDGAMLGPSVQIYTAEHPRDPEIRRTLWEYARPIWIGRNVWIGGGAIILPGVTIGDDAIIGSFSFFGTFMFSSFIFVAL
jgi:maltose O-acetyltransferase